MPEVSHGRLDFKRQKREDWSKGLKVRTRINPWEWQTHALDSDATRLVNDHWLYKHCRNTINHHRNTAPAQAPQKLSCMAWSSRTDQPAIAHFYAQQQILITTT